MVGRNRPSAGAERGCGEEECDQNFQVALRAMTLHHIDLLIRRVGSRSLQMHSEADSISKISIEAGLLDWHLQEDTEGDLKQGA